MEEDDENGSPGIANNKHVTPDDLCPIDGSHMTNAHNDTHGRGPRG